MLQRVHPNPQELLVGQEAHLARFVLHLGLGPQCLIGPAAVGDLVERNGKHVAAELVGRRDVGLPAFGLHMNNAEAHQRRAASALTHKRVQGHAIIYQVVVGGAVERSRKQAEI